MQVLPDVVRRAVERFAKRFSSYAARLAERVFWTAVQAGVGIAAVEVADLPPAYAVPIAAGLSWLKGVIAKKVGNPQDPSTLPWGV